MDDPTTKESADDNEENAIDSKSGSLRHSRGSAPDPYPHELVPGQNTAIWSPARKHEVKTESQKQADCHRAFKTSIYEDPKNINPERIPGTCDWVLQHTLYREWQQSRQDDVLWILGYPGCGKSVLAKAIVDEQLQNSNQHTVCYFFFRFNDNQNNLATALCALLHQLFNHQPLLLRHAMNAFEKIGTQLQTDTDELWRIFTAAVTDDQAVNITCVIDALDECCDDDLPKLIQFLASFHNQRTASTRKFQLKFLVTSRTLQVFANDISGIPTIRLRVTSEESNDDISEEIKIVLRHKVATAGRKYGLSQEVQDVLREKLFSFPHGSVLGLCLVMNVVDEILDKQAWPKMASIKTTNTLSTKVEDAYDNVSSHLKSHQRREAEAFVRELGIDPLRPYALRESRMQCQLAPLDARTDFTESYGTSNVVSDIISGSLVSTKPSSLEEDINLVDEDNPTRQMAKTFYNHTPIDSYRYVADDEIKSLASEPEDIQSQDGTNSTHWEVRKAAASYLAEMLSGDATLRPLYEEASKRLDDERFSRNHGRLLKRYYLSLRSQAANRKQSVAVNFLRPRSNRTLISRKILESTGRERVYLTLPQHDERNLTLERFLNSVEVGPDAITAEAEMPLDIDEEQESSVDGDDQDRLDLVDLKNARSYFTSGTSLAQFKAEFRDFLHLPRMVVEEARTQTQRQTDTEPGRGGNAKSYEWFYSVGFWQSKLTSWLYDAVYPPKSGYQRVRYICECDDHMFLDIKELQPGGVQRFRQRLVKDGLARLITPYDSTTAQDSTADQDLQSSVSLPPPAHFRIVTTAVRHVRVRGGGVLSRRTRYSPILAAMRQPKKPPGIGPYRLQLFRE
ncbi:hypothetical protein CNYM01_10971 [Colletotrichum nymphaeae SA-01]|uniref:NACHT domain-containing protein n=1 Tax=Colletotrichum nymphaeae SA-01 TaxID=1460502 RepID=A0A135TSB1_9PEZI|nr:hypothetical protein CNYM01_10971 [Colletotrichum nymphaeae SA-01]